MATASPKCARHTVCLSPLVQGTGGYIQTGRDRCERPEASAAMEALSWASDHTGALQPSPRRIPAPLRVAVLTTFTDKDTQAQCANAHVQELSVRALRPGRSRTTDL